MVESGVNRINFEFKSGVKKFSQPSGLVPTPE